jgi:hypothetical protein
MTPMVGTDRIKLDTIFAALAVLLSVLAVVTGNPRPPHMRPSCIQIRLACSVDGSWESRWNSISGAPVSCEQALHC